MVQQRVNSGKAVTHPRRRERRERALNRHVLHLSELRWAKDVLTEGRGTPQDRRNAEAIRRGTSHQKLSRAIRDVERTIVDAKAKLGID